MNGSMLPFNINKPWSGALKGLRSMTVTFRDYLSICVSYIMSLYSVKLAEKFKDIGKVVVLSTKILRRFDYCFHYLSTNMFFAGFSPCHM